jgi:hypothetical protein
MPVIQTIGSDYASYIVPEKLQALVKKKFPNDKVKIRVKTLTSPC